MILIATTANTTTIEFENGELSQLMASLAGTLSQFSLLDDAVLNIDRANLGALTESVFSISDEALRKVSTGNGHKGA